MAVYKVPQDVEAEDKLLGPFSFRQFIYLIIVVLAIGLAWGLAQLLLPLALLPLPVIIFFGALALPLRKDQPMEIYMAAVVSFYLKPRQRLWDPDGLESLIEITVPKIVEPSRVKDLAQGEVEKRMGYLAQIVDSQGWAVRGQDGQMQNSVMRNDLFMESQQVEDMMDGDTSIAQSFDQKLDQSDNKHHEQLVDMMAGKKTPESIFEPSQNLEYDPYPEINQSVVQPLNEYEQFHDKKKKEEKTEDQDNKDKETSDKPPSADILNLASNTDLSVEAIAREANRIQRKKEADNEVFISLR